MVTMPCSPEEAREFWLDGVFEAKIVRPHAAARTVDGDPPPLLRAKRLRRPRRARGENGLGDMVAVHSDTWAAA